MGYIAVANTHSTGTDWMYTCCLLGVHCVHVMFVYTIQCDAMRISKKFTGDTRIGHVRYPKNPARRLSQVYTYHQENIIDCKQLCLYMHYQLSQL
jgi:hypothetical protein